MTELGEDRSPRTSRTRALISILVCLPAFVSAGVGIATYLQRPAMGEACLRPCRSGFCYSPGDKHFSSYCTRQCEDPQDCPEGYSCTPTGAAGSLFCRRNPTVQLGDRCAAAEECLSNLCVDYRLDNPLRGSFQRSYCVAACSENGECRNGERCELVAEMRVCSPQVLIERDAERRFKLETELGMENQGLRLKRMIREAARDAGGF